MRRAVLPAIIAIVAVAVVTMFAYVGSYTQVTGVTIERVENVVSHGESKYLIFTDREVFENVDSLLFFKWNSSDTYRQLKVGETVTLTVVGWRLPFFSMYRNIIKVIR